jgi:hypothetical protein
MTEKKTAVTVALVVAILNRKKICC